MRAGRINRFDRRPTSRGMTRLLLLLALLFEAGLATAQFEDTYLLRPARVFDGQEVHAGWAVLVRGERIEDVGPMAEIRPPTDARIVELPGTTLLPGLIEGHAHLFLHPYNETSWNDQVLKESEAERVARATVHARDTLLAGFTTVRDLGTEGAGYADVGLKRAIEKGVIDGPRLLVATRAIVATGSYGPKGFAPSFEVPLGAEPADGVDALIRVVRDQIGKGADWVKIYADYRWGPEGESLPTFSQAELELVVETARSSGTPVVAHASTPEGMRRATLAGVETIEHGDGGTPEVFRLMAEKGVALCPTLAATEAVSRYEGWDAEVDEEPERVRASRESFRAALDAGVILCAGSDAGVFRHGDNWLELQLMVSYGMSPLEALRAATSVNARILHLEEQLGSVLPGLQADLVAVDGDPSEDISRLRDVGFVMKAGRIVLEP